MKTVSIRDAKNRLTELAREIEEGETVIANQANSGLVSLPLANFFLAPIG